MRYIYILYLLFVLNIAALLFPYINYDDIHLIGGALGAIFTGFKQEYNLGLTLYSYETLLAYFPLIILSVPYFEILRKSQLAFKYIFVSSGFLLICNVVLFLALTTEPSYYYGYDNIVPTYGYWIQNSSILAIFFISLKYRNDYERQIMKDSNEDVFR